MIGALLCQYHDTLYKSIRLQEGVADGVEYRFRDGLRMFVVLNHGCIYSRRWKKNVEEVIGRRLGTMDAVILGHLNEYDPKYHDAKLWEKVRNYGKKFPDFQVQEAQYPGGFSIKELARVYPGNVVRVSMTALSKETNHKYVVKRMNNITAETGRTNLYAINARDHIVQLGGAECSSDENKLVGTCATRRKSFTYSSGHKCMGNKGGEPDMVAYDVVETLWQIFGTQS